MFSKNVDDSEKLKIDLFLGSSVFESICILFYLINIDDVGKRN